MGRPLKQAEMHARGPGRRGHHVADEHLTRDEIDALDALQRRLMEKEVLDREEVYSVIRENAAGPVPDPPTPSVHVPRESTGRP